MNTYEGMIIFPDRLQDEEIEETLKGLRSDIEKNGGTIHGSTRIGRRLFARPIQKDDYGHYAVVTFDGDSSIVSNLLPRIKLNDKITRVQFVRANQKPAEPAAEEAAVDGSED